MTTRILTYCKCSADSVREIIKLYETNYNCKYSWNKSHRNISDAEVVAVKEVDGHRYVITHCYFEHFLEFYGVNTKTLGELI